MSLFSHLKSGATSVCHAWKVTRRDGVTFGFTDHDNDLRFDGMTFAAQTGLTARALQQTTGLSVDNTEAFGALSAASVREEDILAGRFDNAEVTAYLVNWENPDERDVLFNGNFGEISWGQGAFQTDMRGLSERLNMPFGRVYHGECAANLGDHQCKIDLTRPGFSVQTAIKSALSPQVFILTDQPEQPAGWFASGLLQVLDGAAMGLSGTIRSDEIKDGQRVITLWQNLGITPEISSKVSIIIGCDRLASTCKNKFSNFLNFRGFPHIPGEDWLRSYPNARNVQS